ncbi:MAG: hypothetical protein NC177_05045 [Ruminococcus flavefaciens]|nr:hypothetical protein [Ruminococcus flavefaciens]
MRSSKSDNGFIVKFLRNAVLILFLIIFVSIVYNFRNKESPTESALMAEATSSGTFKGVFIRDEQVIKYSGNGVLSYNVSDGGKLGMGSVIAQVYPTDEQISINMEIANLEKELGILEKIQNPGTLESAQPLSLSANIEENFRNFIYCRDINDYDSVKSDLDTLLVQMSTYQIITNEVTDFNQQIEDINNELAQLRQQSVQPVEVIRSDRPAYFASYCDGFEDILTKDSISQLTIEQLNSVSDTKSTDNTVVGKLIDDYSWYLAGIVDNSHHDYEVGKWVKLRFEVSADTYDAEIVDIYDEGSPEQSIIILACSQFNQKLVQHRCETVEIIRGDYRGLKVPREAIRFMDVTEEVAVESGDGEETHEEVVNCKGVNILKGEQIEFKKIDVIYEGSDYVLSAVHDEDSSYLSLYDDIMIEGVE